MDDAERRKKNDQHSAGIFQATVKLVSQLRGLGLDDETIRQTIKAEALDVAMCFEAIPEDGKASNGLNDAIDACIARALDWREKA